MLCVLAQSTDGRTLVIPDRFMPSIPRLAKQTGLSENAVRTHLRGAVSAGWLEWSPGGSRGRGDRSKFILTAPQKGAPPEPFSPQEGSGGAPFHTRKGSAPEPFRAEKGSGAEPTQQKTPSTTSIKASARVTVAVMIRSAFPDATDEEIEIITRDRRANGARSVSAVLGHEIANGALRLPCDTDSDAPHSSDCRGGDGGLCSVDWCGCRCHLKPKDPR